MFALIFVAAAVCILIAKEGARVQVTPGNLREIWSILRFEMLRRDSFPKSLNELQPGSSEISKLFVCPGTESKPGTMTNVEEWTDYIYIGNVQAFDPNTVLLISPPENHQGEFGYVLFQGGNVSRLASNEVRNFIADPLRIATNVGPEIVASLRTQMVIHIPKYLRQKYDQNGVR